MPRRIEVTYAEDALKDEYLDAMGIPYHTNDNDLVLNKPKSYMFAMVGEDLMLVVWTGAKPTKKQIKNAMWFDCDTCGKELKADKRIYVDGCGWFCAKCVKDNFEEE